MKPSIKQIKEEKGIIKSAQGGSTRSTVGKIYDSHTFYDKHQPYYAAIGNSDKPRIKVIEA